MEAYVISGGIYKASEEFMDELMRAILGDIRMKDHLFGHEIYFENENIRLATDNHHDDGRYWSLNADFKGALPNLTELLSMITQKLISAGFNYDIAYFQMDEHGNEMGEEVSLRHPDFDSMYSPPSVDR